MAWVAVAGAGASVLGGILGKKSDKKMQQQLTTRLGYMNWAGPGGARSWVDDNNGQSGMDLGMLELPFESGSMLANRGLTQANAFLRGGVPAGIGYAAAGLDNYGLDLGTFLRGQSGAEAAGAQALGAMFDPSRTAQGVYERQLGLMRAAAAPQEAMDRRSFIGDLYSTGRGAVTGAPGAEGTLGGGRLAAAFAQGQSRADTERQLAAQKAGFDAAASEEDLISSAFSRFSDSARLAGDFNTAAYNRGYGAMTDRYNRQVQLAGLPASLAEAFATAAGRGLDQSLNIGDYGLAAGNLALQSAAASANARIGSGANVASYMQNRSTTPGLDALGKFFSSAPAGATFGDIFGFGGNDGYSKIGGKVAGKVAGY